MSPRLTPTARSSYSNARPQIKLVDNSNNVVWTSTVPAISTQPGTRTLTAGTHRGNNTMFTFTVPASALVAGTSTLTLYAANGNSGTTCLRPGFSIDAIDML